MSLCKKLLNVGADTLGTICLVYALLIFHGNCVDPLYNSYHSTNLQPRFWSGPGVYCYSTCAVIGGLRAVIHWLVPLPGQTLSCCRNKTPYKTHPVDSDIIVYSGPEQVVIGHNLSLPEAVPVPDPSLLGRGTGGSSNVIWRSAAVGGSEKAVNAPP